MALSTDSLLVRGGAIANWRYIVYLEPEMDVTPKIWNAVIPGRFSGTAQVERGRLETGSDRYWKRQETGRLETGRDG
jgi:hypothetical protein